MSQCFIMTSISTIIFELFMIILPLYGNHKHEIPYKSIFVCILIMILTSVTPAMLYIIFIAYCSDNWTLPSAHNDIHVHSMFIQDVH